MLIQTLTFEIHNPKAAFVDHFLIENTVENQEKVFGHRFTRNIQFTQTFDFQFDSGKKYPIEMIPFSTEIENELDEIDEMVGTF